MLAVGGDTPDGTVGVVTPSTRLMSPNMEVAPLNVTQTDGLAPNEADVPSQRQVWVQ